MRILIAASLLLAALLLSTSAGQQVPPRPPGLRDGQKEINKPVDPPLELPRTPASPAKLKDEAEELAQLSSSIPAKINLVSHGQLPKDLANQLKRIEKLAKHLRSQVSP